MQSCLSDMKRDTEVRHPATQAIVASVVTLAYFLTYPFAYGCAALGSPYQRSDASLFDYAAWFRAFIDPAGGDLGQVIPPSPYLALLTLAYRLTGPWCYTPYVLNALLAAVGAGLLHRLTLDLFGRTRTAVFATGLYALSPGLIFHVGLAMKTPMEMLLVAAALYALACCLRSPTFQRATMVSAVVGLLVMERNHAMPALVALPLLAWLPGSKGSRALSLTAATVPALAILTASALASPASVTSPVGINFYLGNSIHSSGAIVPIPGIRDDLIGHHTTSADEGFTTPGVSPVASRDQLAWIAQALREHVDAPWGFVALQADKLGMLLARQAPGSPELAALFRPDRLHLRMALADFGMVLALALPGMVLAWTQWQRTPVLRVLIVIPLVYALTLLAFFIIERYRLPLLCMLIPFAAHSLEQCLNRAPSWGRIAAAGIVLYALSIALESRNPVGPGWPADHERAGRQVQQGLALAAQRQRWHVDALERNEASAWRRLGEYYANLGLHGDAAAFHGRALAGPISAD